MTSIHTRTAFIESNGHADPTEVAFQRLKSKIHEQLVDSLNLSIIGELSEDQFADEVRVVAEDLCRHKAASMSSADRTRMVDELMNEVFGLGPLEQLMKDPSITDILVNRPHEVYVERHGQLELTNVLFADDQHVIRTIQRLIARVGRRIDEVSPMVDARLPDGSRVNAVVPPLSVDGPTLSIRRFGTVPLQIDDLIENASMTTEMADFLAAAVDARISFLVSGGAGAGKTTMLNALSAFVPPTERMVTIEDSAEMKLQHKHVIRLETRTPNTEGVGAVTQRELVRNALRMRPDRILVGEVRGAEALDMLQAMNSGHEGSLSTIHSNDTRDALARLEMMVAMSGFELPVAVVRQYIASGIKLIVHLARLKGGARRVMCISEIVGVEDGSYKVEDIFGFRQTGVDEDGVAIGEFYVSGYRPACLDRLRAAGLYLSDSLFEERRTQISGTSMRSDIVSQQNGTEVA